MFTFIKNCYLVGLFLCTSAHALAAGQVIFVSGEAHLIRNNQRQLIKNEQRVAEGDHFTTSQNGFVYIRLDDQGLFVLRPNTQASIDEFRYSPGQAQDTAIKLNLKKGIARVVTGQASKEFRDRFRLNTPVAAIGVRGTDFTIFTNDVVTRAAINHGAIIVANISNSCRADMLGPCNTTQTLTLNAQDIARVAEVRRDLNSPRIISNDKLHPEKSSPRGPEEPQSQSPSSPDSLDKEAIKLEQLLMKQEQPIRQVNWGRWQKIAQMPATADLTEILRTEPIELLAISSHYAIYRQQQTRTELPQSGIVNFNLKAHEGYFVSWGFAETAIASNAQLQIDFGKQIFNTQLTLQSQQFSVNINTQGTLGTDGRFTSDPLSGSKISGGLGGALNNEAAYLYQLRINNQLNVYGATYWSR